MTYILAIIGIILLVECWRQWTNSNKLSQQERLDLFIRTNKALNPNMTDAQLTEAFYLCERLPR